MRSGVIARAEDGTVTLFVKGAPSRMMSLLRRDSAPHNFQQVSKPSCTPLSFLALSAECYELFPYSAFPSLYCQEACLPCCAIACRAVPCCAMLCCARLCYAVPCATCSAALCCAALCCAVSCCAVLCHAELCCAAPCCAVLCCNVLCCALRIRVVP